MNRLLLCPPDFYSIRYEINPWMNQSRDVDPTAARFQWWQLHHMLHFLGCEVEVLAPAQGWPDMVFTANAGLVHGRRFVSSRFRHPERQGETPAYEAWFATHGYDVQTLPGNQTFEGEGDALWLGETLVCGHGFRSDPEAHDWLAEALHCAVLSVRLVNSHFYHLDTCFCPLADGAALWYEPAFDAESRKRLRQHVPQLIAVSDPEALRFACNTVIVDKHAIMPAGCVAIGRCLREMGYECHPLPMGEFIKAGGACKCLVLQMAKS